MSLLNVISTDISIIARHKFGRVGRCPQNVLHLVSVGQWMQVRSGSSEADAVKQQAGQHTYSWLLRPMRLAPSERVSRA